MKPTFEVQTFEQVLAGPGTVLLRITGRWAGTARERLPAPLLLVDDGRRTHRLPPLPGPEDSTPRVGPEGHPWRGAFSAPAGLIGGRAAFALEAGRAGIVDLPRPTKRGGILGPAPPPAPPRLTAVPALAPEEESRTPRSRRRHRGRHGFEAADPGARASDLSALQKQLADEREARESAERRAAQATAIARQAAAEAQRAADIARQAEAARAGAVDALTDERLRASEREAELALAREEATTASRAARAAEARLLAAEERIAELTRRSERALDGAQDARR